MAGINELFDGLLSGSKKSREAKDGGDTSMIFGSYLGAELSLLLFYLAMVSLFILLVPFFGFIISLLLVGFAIVVVTASMPTVFKIRRESSDDFSLLGFYMLMSLILFILLLVWGWLR